MNDLQFHESNRDDWRALLLHQLPEADAQRLELRLLEDPHALDALQIAEQDLYDDYARNRLNADARAAFERHLAHQPESRERLRFSRALAAAQPVLIERRSRFAATARRSRWRNARSSLAGGAIAAGLALAVVFSARYFPPPQTATEIGAGTIETRVLLASNTRGADDAQVLVIPADVATFRVQAEIAEPEAAARYRITVFTAEGVPLVVVGDLPLHTAGRFTFIEAQLPAAAIRSQARRVRLEAQAPANPFAFDWRVAEAP